MLFKTTSEIQQYMEINTHVNFDSLKSSIRAAEKELVVPIIGLDFYLDLDEKVNANTLSLKEKSLLQVIQAALAPHAVYLYVPKAEVNIVDGGVRRNENDTSKTAYQYQVTNLRHALLTESEKAVEYLIAFLESKKTDYPQWLASEEFKKYRNLFIKTGGEFNEYFRTQSPYRNYWAMRSVMEDVEQLVIKKMLGVTQFEVLKSKSLLDEPNWTLYEKELLYKIKKCIANLTIANAVSQMAVRIDEAGITVTSGSISASNDAQGKRAAAADNQLSQLLRESKATGEAWMNESLKYLKANATLVVFPEWFVWQLSLLTPPVDVSGREEFCERLNGTFSLF